MRTPRADRPNAQWALVGHLAAAMVAGYLAGSAIGSAAGALLSALTAAGVAAVGRAAPRAVAGRAATVAAVVVVVAVGVASVTSGDAWGSAIAVAVVAIGTSVLAAGGRVGAALGTLASYVFLLAATAIRASDLAPSVPVGTGLLLVVVGALVGLALALAGLPLRRAPRDAPAAPARPGRAAPLFDTAAVVRSLRTFDERARDGVRRAIPLAIGLYLFERSGSRDALWVFVAAVVVLLPTGKQPITVALARVASTLLAVLLVAPVALLVPTALLGACGVVALLVGLAYHWRRPLLAGGLTALGSILLAGAAAGNAGTWAQHRLLDTLLGCGLALATTFLLWPADRPDDTADGGPTESDRDLVALPARERRRAVAASILRSAFTIAAVLWLYYAAPVGGDRPAAHIVLQLVVGLLVFVVLFAWQVLAVTAAPHPQLRAVETLCFAGMLFVVTFAGVYATLGAVRPQSFTAPLDRTGALYFAVETFSTVGFGDITPVGDLPRVLVTVQMVCDLVYLAVAARIVFGASRRARRKAPAVTRAE